MESILISISHTTGEQDLMSSTKEKTKIDMTDVTQKEVVCPYDEEKVFLKIKSYRFLYFNEKGEMRNEES
ncbi:hypothetical protein [Sediminispirochaeta smaragdinae]|uniref:Uncharacterized protein n=1 Tax=Sediminispirochaeta smaragdinae (strain DSM 11293 / JCM 15392 / SEBR 4228) TaxID=573413 RepID=E1R8D1_SEDSS|nr:hypothetical protein [Sediminispirochaeta smaragdinae]ADK79275.1 hypothetical protein Spirs_0117 [Sediminispirochaeta smaragdinae DSM 11293]